MQEERHKEDRCGWKGYFCIVSRCVSRCFQACRKPCVLRRNPCSVSKRVTDEVHSSRAKSEPGSKGHFSVSSSSSRPEEGSRYPLGSLDTRVRNLREHLRGRMGSAEGLGRDTGEGGRDGQTDIQKKKANKK